MDTLIQPISIAACFLIVIVLLFRIRQSHEDDRVLVRCLMAAMGSLALAYFWKGCQRFDGDPANINDLWRDLSLLVVLTLRVTNVKKQHGKL